MFTAVMPIAEGVSPRRRVFLALLGLIVLAALGFSPPAEAKEFSFKGSPDGEEVEQRDARISFTAKGPMDGGWRKWRVLDFDANNFAYHCSNGGAGYYSATFEQVFDLDEDWAWHGSEQTRGEFIPGVSTDKVRAHFRTDDWKGWAVGWYRHRFVSDSGWTCDTGKVHWHALNMG
jgi:hypothetical protein